MYYCPNCSNLFTITNNVDNIMNKNKESNIKNIKQKGGDINYEKLIKSIIDTGKKDIEIPTNISLNKLIESVSYKKLNAKEKEYVYNYIYNKVSDTKKNITQTSSTIKKKIYFKCLTCGTYEEIKDVKLIFNSVGSDISQSYVTSDLNNMKYSDIIPRTRKYICPNKKCPSHNNYHQREAVFFRLNNSFRIKYICLTCDTSFSNR